MGAKDNLNKAMFDMLGLGKEEQKATVFISDDKAAKEKKILKNADIAEPKKIVVTETVSPTTYIAPSMEIEGCIKAKGDVEIAGALKGDIDSEGTVIIRSSVVGNISAKYLQLIDCSVIGDIAVSESIMITEKSTVNGNIKAKSVSCSGTINGDIAAEGNLLIYEKGYIVGNISAATLAVARGAVIKGKLSM